jgi:DNA-directed RNA polymerase specialized sigma24 family protein
MDRERKSSEARDFEALTKQHKDAVYRQMIRVCGNHEDAEDVLIEALLKAHRHLDQLRDSAAFRTWLARIGKRVCWQLRAQNRFCPCFNFRRWRAKVWRSQAASLARKASWHGGR